MDITVAQFLFIVVLAFCCEFIDSALGMGYGTILSPVLIIMGMDPIIVIPSILLSQAAGGFTASIFHHRFRNVDFHPTSKDSKIVFVITSFGMLATILAAIIAISIPKVVLKTYIGILVLVMGVILLSGRRFRFEWRRIIGIGVVSAFNKSLTGGGFGPVVTAGQILSGQDDKASIGCTTLAEAPICIVGFITFMVVRVIREIDQPILSTPVRDFFHTVLYKNIFDWELILAMLLGAVLVAPFGAFTTKIADTSKLRVILGILVVILGLWTLAKTFL